MPGHPVQKLNSVQRRFPYSGFDPLNSVRTAIEVFDPDVVIPSCDRGVQHLHELHSLSQSQGALGRKTAAVIERSLGSPESFPIVSSRYELLRVARSEGILVPDTIAINGSADLKPWTAETASHWVLKADGTWGGRGVRMAQTPIAAERNFLELTRRGQIFDLIKRLILNRDRGWVLLDWKQSRPKVIAQLLIEGRPANCAVVCWQGKMLAGIGVEVIMSQGPKGPAVVVQVVESVEMMLAAERIARRLRLSGFFGLDFMIENGTGATYLIEMNPRCTPPCPLPLGTGRDLPAAMWAQLAAQPVPESRSVTRKNKIAYFPQAWDSADDLLDSSPPDSIYHDIPDGEPEFIRELLHPWSERSLLGRIVDRARRRRMPEKRSTVYVFTGANVTLEVEGAARSTTS
jgi:hypothetical protein